MRTPRPITQAPGAGLPWLERVITRRFGAFYLHACFSWRSAEARFLEETQRIADLCDPLTDAAFSTPVLIARVRGLEDSSRQWSCEMTLEHLMLTGAAFDRVLTDLTHFRVPDLVIDTAVVKPTGGMGRPRLGAFCEWAFAFPEHLRATTGPDHDQTRHPHPWFGPLNAEQWFALCAVHQSIHRRQIERIVAALPR